MEVEVRDARHLNSLLSALDLPLAAESSGFLLQFAREPQWRDAMVEREIGHGLESVLAVRERIQTGQMSFSHDRILEVRQDSYPGYRLSLDVSVSQNEKKAASLVIDWQDDHFPSSSAGRLQRWEQFAELVYIVTDTRVDQASFIERPGEEGSFQNVDDTVSILLTNYDDESYQIDADTAPSLKPWMLAYTSPHSTASYVERVEGLKMRLDFPYGESVERTICSEDTLDSAVEVALEGLRQNPECVAGLLEVGDALLIVTRASTVETVLVEYRALLQQERYEGSQFVNRTDWVPNSVDLEDCKEGEIVDLVQQFVAEREEEVGDALFNLVEGRDHSLLDLGLDLYTHPQTLRMDREILLSKNGDAVFSVNASLKVGMGDTEAQIFLTHAPGTLDAEGVTGVEVFWPEISTDLTSVAGEERWRIVDELATRWTGFPVPESLNILEKDDFAPGRLFLGERMGITLEGH
jgi:hypothetical protein